ncbi:MAG: high-affinity iron transporter [Promethearchaeota archaeon]|nr:MAG: high-affinity iron transporter [Candidatus Lokiarchaeota archaeon]
MVIASFIIIFREVLEAVLVISIVLGYISKINKPEFKKWVWYGTFAGVAASFIGKFLFDFLIGGFEGQAEALFEGFAMLIGAVLITTMIFWMAGQKKIAHELEKRVDVYISSSKKGGIFFLVFISIIREGIELVIFLTAAEFASESLGWLGTILGFVVGIGLGVLLYFGTIKFNIKTFFNVTSIILILFAAGLIAHGIHELQEGGLIPFVLYPLYDLNSIFPVPNPLNENSAIGSILKALFGYNGNPGLIELIGYWVYLMGIISLWIIRSKVKPMNENFNVKTANNEKKMEAS